MKLKKLITLMISSLMLLSVALADGDVKWMPDISDDSKSLTVCYEHKEEGIEGVELEVYKFADASCYLGKVTYEAVSGFDNYGVDFEELSVDGSKFLAKIIKTDNVKVYGKAKTDAKGKAKFNNLEPGMYLVKQKSQAYSKGYIYKMDQFLVTVPQADGDKWLDNVIAYPKTEIVRTSPSPTPTPEVPDKIPPSTGDNVNLITYLALGAIAISVIAGILLGGRKDD